MMSINLKRICWKTEGWMWYIEYNDIVIAIHLSVESGASPDTLGVK